MDNNGSGGASASSSSTQPGSIQKLKDHIAQNKLDAAMWFSRVLTIIFTLGYLIPIFGNPHTAYYKVLMANAATSALRLRQRLPPVSLSREFVSLLLLEDSCHYLLFSLIFLYVSPMVLILFPVTLFAILHSASYSLTLLDTLGQNSWWGARLMISIVEFQTKNILRLVSFSEILLMPLCIIFVFMGRAGLITPMVYYHFLMLRYSSRRNPYTRNMFYELRLKSEAAANNPAVPAILRNTVHKCISVISRLAPPMQPAPPPQN